MRMRGIWPALVFSAMLFLLLGASAWAQKVKTGYDKSADFSRYKTYAWIPRATPATNPVLASIIDHDIEYELNEKGLRKVDGNADLLVQSYGGSNEVVGGYAAEPGYTGTGGYAMPGAQCGAVHYRLRLSRRSCTAQLPLTWWTPGRSILCGVQSPKAKWITTSAANCWSRRTRLYRKCSNNTRRQSNDSRCMHNPASPMSAMHFAMVNLAGRQKTSTAAHGFHGSEEIMRLAQPGALRAFDRRSLPLFLLSPTILPSGIGDAGNEPFAVGADEVK